MASRVSIANIAMTILGADRITSLEDNAENARRLTAIYDACREEVLRAHPWNFALIRTQLSRLSSTPVFGFDYEFQLPSDCLRVVQVNNGADVLSDDDFKIEGRKLLSDEDTIYIKYIGNITDSNQYTSQFIYLFATRLAAELAYAITNNKSTMELVAQLYADRLETAKAHDSQESSSAYVEDEDLWTTENR